MSDCLNAEMRDLLPDLAAERLSGAERARVASHVASCDACASELEMLSAARRVMSRGVPAVDVARIVAALPKPPAAGDAKPALVASSASASAPRLAGIADARGRQSKRPARLVPYVSRWTALRIAALAMVAVGGLTVAVIHHRGSALLTNPTTDTSIVASGVPSEQPAPTQATPAPTRPSAASPSQAPSTVASQQKPSGGDAGVDEGPGLAVASDISELSDGEVESLLQDMNGLDDQPSADPDAAVPALPTGAAP